MVLLVVEQVPPCYGIKKKLLAFHNQLFFYPQIPCEGKSAVGLDYFSLTSENLSSAGWFFSQKHSLSVGAALSRESFAHECATAGISNIFGWIFVSVPGGTDHEVRVIAI